MDKPPHDHPPSDEQVDKLKEGNKTKQQNTAKLRKKNALEGQKYVLLEFCMLLEAAAAENLHLILLGILMKAAAKPKEEAAKDEELVTVVREGKAAVTEDEKQGSVCRPKR